ncbi:hypothetical protein J8273_8426 [Carpediemonas membranifera]|uniref:Uncharacterized protein n=1 Tax=Carpediemonas membranifera TaxID=201153 RepID=A0A8J6E0T2_9EUKA|nr:hypothetical protein J8273_8426 [Carpediemonas membranifera]|eukprot:KAG9389752.1 hypothetical protein J8273_8426 [Carpediemonas membranifera]
MSFGRQEHECSAREHDGIMDEISRQLNILGVRVAPDGHFPNPVRVLLTTRTREHPVRGARNQARGLYRGEAPAETARPRRPRRDDGNPEPRDDDGNPEPRRDDGNPELRDDDGNPCGQSWTQGNQ